jgi:capsular exopolysaccharide synthesis family protein
MSISEILSVLWHRKLIVIGVLAVVIGVAIGALQLIKPEYRSTATLAASPTKPGTSNLVFFQVVNQVMSIYATAATTEATLDAAKERTGGDLSDISVQTFDGAPVMKIDARGTDRVLTVRSAQAVATSWLEQVRTGEVGVPGFKLTEIDRPRLPTEPIYPNKKLTYAVAVLIGLGLGIAAALLWETLGRRVRTRSDLTQAAGVPVFAELPVSPPVRDLHDLASFGSDPDLRSVSEALRDLRTSLVFANDRLGSIVVTSPEGRHGKTTVAAGLATTLARAGTQTILVDADMHRGRVASMLRMAHSPGLRETLQGAEPGAIIRRATVANLDVLMSGHISSDPGELLATSFEPLLDWLEQAYEAVVIDAPPLAPVNDARVIARLANVTLLVCAAGKASPRAVHDAVERLSLVGVTPTASILNMSRSRQARGYYGPPADSVHTDRAEGTYEAGPPPVESRRTPSP